MEEAEILLDYIKRGIAKNTNLNDLKINALKNGYSSKAFDSALAKANESISNKEPKKKSLARKIFGIPSSFIYPLTWTIFFAILGIIVQSLAENKWTFLQFFTSNLTAWLAKFNFFSNPAQYSGALDLIQSLASEWYYFGFIGGLLSLLWVFIAWLLSLFKKE